MNKNRIRLTESQLHQVIKESVKKTLAEATSAPSNWDRDRIDSIRNGEDYVSEAIREAIEKLTSASYDLESFFYNIGNIDEYRTYVDYLRKTVKRLKQVLEFIRSNQLMRYGQQPDEEYYYTDDDD